MPVKAENITFQEIKEILALIPVTDLKETEMFLVGDHWQQGNGWVGWRPESNSAEAIKQYVLVERLFNAKNVCGGMVKRIQGATLGKEPDWDVVDKEAPKAPLRPKLDAFGNPLPAPEIPNPFQAEKDALLEWWEEKEIHRILKEFVSNRTAYGKSAIRIFIPSGFITQKSSDGLGVVDANDFKSALKKIVVEVPHYDSVNDAEDVEFGQRYSVIQLKKRTENESPRYEVSEITEDGKTLIRIMSEQKDTEAKLAIDLGGHLMTIVDGKYTDAMISKTVKMQQKAVNHAKTGESFALANINFPEVTFINTALETEKKTDPTTNKQVDVVKPLRQGPGIWRNIVGLLTERADGTQELATPDIRYKDPADPEKFALVADNNTRDMHQEAGMLYIYLADSEYASGDSKVESMTDYLILLVDKKTMLDNIGQALLTTVMRLALSLTGQPERMDKFRVLFNTNLTIGRLSVDEKDLMLREVSAGLRSKRGYMVKAEVTDDPDSELAVVAADPPTMPIQPTFPAPQPNGNGNGSGKKPAPASK